jgi:carbon monoxide dehydrogenase subunit G
MEVKIESKIGSLNQLEQNVYDFISDCNNFTPLANSGAVKDWFSDADSCRFSVAGIGQLACTVVERTPNKMVKFAIENPQTENVFLWVQLKSSELTTTHVKLTTKLNANPMIKMLISKPLKQALDKIVDTLEQHYTH